MTGRVPLRLLVAGVALAATALLAVLVTQGLGSGVVYYYTPGEVSAGKAAASDVIRVGGTVAPGTVRFDRDRGVLTFMLVGDGGDGRLAVAARRAPPRLFAPGRQTLVEGRLASGVLRSSDIIVKHDENYRAPAERAPR